MPQMFPLIWLTLFISINVLLVIMTNIIHFSLKPEVSASSKNTYKAHLNFHSWKW